MLRREWLGCALAVLFAVFAEAAIAGVLLVPGVIPVWIMYLAFAAAGATWLVGQLLLRKQMGVMLDPARKEEIALLRDRAAEAASAGKHTEAVDLVRLALVLDDEDIETNHQWAELMTATGDSRQARKYWQRVKALDREKQYRREIAAALKALGD